MITFIIPSIGKHTLQQTINSIENQTIVDWKAIIIFDGVEPTLFIDNPKFSILKIDKNGVGKNGAGNVRNHGMKFVDTEWIAFLDDDDTIAPDYIETFNKEITEYSFVDVLIFRMHKHILNNAPKILPKLNTDNFYVAEVGISFLIKANIFKKGFGFKPSHIEDFEYLSTLRDNNYCIMISPYVKYFVDQKYDPEIVSQTGNRVIINGIKKEFGRIDNNIYHWGWICVLFFLIGMGLFFSKKMYKYRNYFVAFILIWVIVLLCYFVVFRNIHHGMIKL